jgi:hypothetical protein
MRRDYNAERPHSSLGWQTPLAFAATWQRRCAQRDRTLPRSEGIAPCPVAIGAKVVSHGRYVTFQMAEVAVSRQMFVDMLALIARLRAPPAPA